MESYQLVGNYEAFIPGRSNGTYPFTVLFSPQNRQMGWKPSIHAPIIFLLYRHKGSVKVPVLVGDVTPEDVSKIPWQLSEMTKGRRPALEAIVEANKNTLGLIVDNAHVIAAQYGPT